MSDKPKSKLDQLPPRRSLFAVTDEPLKPFVYGDTPIEKALEAHEKHATAHGVGLRPFMEHQKLGRPRVEDKDKTLEATKPWLALDMSRATWFDRKRKRKEEISK